MSVAVKDAGAARRQASETVRRSGTSFAAGMAILPKRRRAAMHAIYAFCRAVDDIADAASPADEKMRRLSDWRAEIDRLYAGRPASPAGLALLDPIRDFDLPKQEFLMMIEGMEMDASGPIVAPTMERLFAYTRRVAGSVGLLSMPVFGAPPGEASDCFALALADALQLTNILRDVAEDAAMGRLYLPAELLERRGATADIMAEALARRRGGPRADSAGADALALIARDLAAIAARKFAEARAALDDLDWRRVRPALFMMGVYERYFSALEKRGWDRIGEPLSLSKAEKLLAAARYALRPPVGRPT
jgi:phytoene synthase